MQTHEGPETGLQGYLLNLPSWMKEQAMGLAEERGLSLADLLRLILSRELEASGRGLADLRRTQLDGHDA